MSEELSGNILRLHNSLQSRGCSPKIEWAEEFEGPKHDCIWVSTLIVNGVAMGTGRGKRKQISRDLAAGQALLGLNLQTEQEASLSG